MEVVPRRAEARQRVAAGVAPGGAQSSRSPHRSRSHPFGAGSAGLGRWGEKKGGAAAGLPPRSRCPSPPGFPGGLPGDEREANSSCAGEKLLGWGESGGILSTGTRLALFDAELLPCSSANSGKSQALPRKFPVVVRREGEKENNMSSEWHLSFFCLLLSWPGLEEGLGTSAAVLRALPVANSPRS